MAYNQNGDVAMASSIKRQRMDEGMHRVRLRKIACLNVVGAVESSEERITSDRSLCSGYLIKTRECNEVDL